MQDEDELDAVALDAFEFAKALFACRYEEGVSDPGPRSRALLDSLCTEVLRDLPADGELVEMLRDRLCRVQAIADSMAVIVGLVFEDAERHGITVHLGRLDSVYATVVGLDPEMFV